MPARENRATAAARTRRSLLLSVALLPVLVGAWSSCNQIVGIGEGKPYPDACLAVADCPMKSLACSLVECKQGRCVFAPQVPCYTGSADTRGIGVCVEGMQACGTDGTPIGDCTGEGVPRAETCDPGALDEDCDGEANEEGPDCECGDGFVSNAEECDDGNPEDTDACTTQCKNAACGDGFVWAGMEECDDGNPDGTDACTTQCKVAECGDGFVRAGIEQCDDGNLVGGDGCSATCTTTPAELTVGTYHACVRFESGSVKCWGNNQAGQLGLGDTNHRGDFPNEMGVHLKTVDLGMGRTAKAIEAGHFHTCARLDNGTVKCWGDNYAGALGQGDAEHRGDGPNEMGDDLPPLDLGTGRIAKALTVGSFDGCAILDNDLVKCWGLGEYGVLGTGNTQAQGDAPNEMGDYLLPIALGTGKQAKQVVLGAVGACALLHDNTLKCWGRNSHGQLGLGDTNHRGDVPNEMGDALPAVSLGAGQMPLALPRRQGEFFSCVILSSGAVKCWGGNDQGPLGQGDTTPRGDGPNEMGDNLVAIDLGAGKTAISMALSPHSENATGHVCVILNDGAVKCWGRNDEGQLGQGDTNHRGDESNEMGDNLVRVDLGTGRTAKMIGAGWKHNCAILDDDSVKCWGSNGYGQLGLGDFITRGAAPNEMGDNLLPVKLW